MSDQYAVFSVGTRLVRWLNIYSRYLLRVLYVSQKASDSANSPADDERVSRAAASVAVADSSVLEPRSTHQMPADETAAATVANPVSDSGSGRLGRTMPSLGSSTSPTTNGELQAEAAAEELTFSEGAFDPEVPHKPDWFNAPRSLAVHPDASKVRHYCRGFCDCLLPSIGRKEIAKLCARAAPAPKVSKMDPESLLRQNMI